MVLVDRSELPAIYSSVKATAAENVDSCTILLIASHSCDSIASCGILTRMLEDDLVSHKVVPVTDYSEVRLPTRARTRARIAAARAMAPVPPPL